VKAPLFNADLLIPLDKVSKHKYLPLLNKEGFIIDEQEKGSQIITIPFLKIAQEHFGEKIFSNAVAMGAVCSVLGIPIEILEICLKGELSKKGDTIVNHNLKAVGLGYQYASEICQDDCGWNLTPQKQSFSLMTGTEGVALGAAVAGCRFVTAYPMTPATGIITTLTRHSKKLKVFTEQAEDEIAAVNMAIGASFAGVRSMTATSGGGFALMTEGISLAGITETPLVIVLAQRPGPATGLPTRTEQGDLLFAIHAGHGEFPKLIFAPSDPEDAMNKMVRAFQLSEKYQIPAIVLSDQFLAVSEYTYDALQVPLAEINIPSANPDHFKEYKRYQLSEDGISPRLYPGQSQHLVCCDSDEHDESGHITEDLSLRNKMVEKRLNKIQFLKSEMAVPEEFNVTDAEVILLSWGSTKYSVLESVRQLHAQGEKVGFIHFTELWPLPEYRFPGDKHYFTVEGNATGQLARLLQSEYPVQIEGSITRYDGLPLDSQTIVGRYHDVIS